MSLITPRKGYKSVPWLFGKEIEIPEEWEKTTVGEHTFILIGNAFPSKEYSENSKDMRLLRGDNVTEGTARWGEKTRYWSNYSEFKKYQLLENDFVISMDGSKVGKNYTYIKKLDLPCLLVQRVACLRSKSTLIQKYFGHIFGDKTFINYVNSVRTNSGIPHISAKDIQNFALLLPPLPEQQKIATILSNVDNLIESTEKVITHSKKVKTGLMQKLLTRGIGHTKFKKVPWLFGKEIEIPEEWESIILQNISEHITKGTTPTTDGGKFMKKGILFIKVESIDNVGNIQIEKCKFIDIETHEQLLRSQLVENDILFSIAGTLGRVGLIKKDQTPSNTNQAISIIRLKNQKFNLFYLFIFLRSIFIKKQIQRLETVGAQPNLSLTQVSNFQLFSPPLPEQQKIATILSNVDDKIISQVQYKEKLLLLKKSLMQKLLTGEVRV